MSLLIMVVFSTLALRRASISALDLGGIAREDAKGSGDDDGEADSSGHEESDGDGEAHGDGEAEVWCKQKTAYEILRSDWSSDVCSSDLKRP